MAYAMLIGFTSLTVHSLFNNFLDTDKIAALFYLPVAFFMACFSGPSETLLNAKSMQK
jgi:hypothetical protein